MVFCVPLSRVKYDRRSCRFIQKCYGYVPSSIRDVVSVILLASLGAGSCTDGVGAGGTVVLGGVRFPRYARHRAGT